MAKKRKAAKQQVDDDQAQADKAAPSIEGLDAMNDIKASWPSDVGSMFSADIPQPYRQELWEKVIDSAAQVCDRFAWATPDDRALRILDHFGAIIEIGAGAGPLALQKTLLLCYPDDFEESDESMAARCLQELQGDTLVHCGELFGDCPMLDKAPWGRTSAPEFQQELFARFRCVLKVPLPSWPHCNDFLTVWRRAHTCTVRLPDDSSAESGSDGAGRANGAESSGSAGTPPTAAPAAAAAGASASDSSQGSDAPSGSGPDGSQSSDRAEAVDELGGSKQPGAGSGGEAGSSDSDGQDADVEFVCDFRSFGLATEQPARGWAIGPLQHLL